MKRVSLIDSIVEEIKDKILSGEYKDGDMLESQDMMAKSMNISRPSLREALRRLQLMGLIEFKHGKGTFVKTLQPQDYMSPISAFLPIDKKTAFEILEARLYLEGSVAALAAEMSTDDDIQELEKSYKVMESVASKLDVDTYVELDLKFHMLVAQACKNRIMIQVVRIIRGLHYKQLKRVFNADMDQVKNIFEHGLKFHWEIIESLREHDAKKARKIMEDHIKYTLKKLENTSDTILRG